MPQLLPAPASGVPSPGSVLVSRAVEDVLAASDLDGWEAWDALWLPRRPFAADDPRRGVYRMSRRWALARELLEANCAGMVNLVVIDCDEPDAELRGLSARDSHALPNLIVENPLTGRAHLGWVLAEPVTTTDYARLKPLNYLTSVLEGLRRATGGDRDYGGLLTKNPFHPRWNAHHVHYHRYSLDELHAPLASSGSMPEPGWMRRRAHLLDPSGPGRNCALFTTARRWAYREVRHHFGDPAGLEAAIRAGAAERNQAFSDPLPAAEVRAIADSISRWILTRSRLWRQGPKAYDQTFHAIQTARGRKSGELKTAQTGQIRGRVEREAFGWER